jgi:hypothetical protein
MSVKLNDEHQVPWRAPPVGRLLVFRGVKNREVFPAAATGPTHALDGWSRMATPGLSVAGNAQRNGFTAARTTSNDPLLPYETISFSLAKNQRFAWT